MIHDVLVARAHIATIFALGLLLSELRNGGVHLPGRRATFTIEEISAAHGKPGNGGGFRRYVQELIALGVERYDTYIGDGHSEYFGRHGPTVTSQAAWLPMEIADVGDGVNFRARLNLHRKGGIDYDTFCKDAAGAGVHKWTVNMQTLTCTYYDRTAKEILVEQIADAPILE